MYKLCKPEQSAQRQRQLERGLLEMMKHHRFEEISVSDLCDRMQLPENLSIAIFPVKTVLCLRSLTIPLWSFMRPAHWKACGVVLP